MKMMHKSVYFKTPSIEELEYTEMLLNDKETMSFNDKWGGTVPFPKEKWASFHERYCTGRYDKEYFHIYNLDHVFVGEVSMRYNEQYESFVLNIKILHRYRGNHHAIDALELFFEYVFEERNIHRIVDDVARENEAAISLLKHLGFTEVFRNEDIVLLECTKEQYFGK